MFGKLKPKKRQLLDIPLYTKIGPHWAEHLQDIFHVEGSNFEKNVYGLTGFERDGIAYSITNNSRCVVGEPWHLQSKWHECRECHRYGMNDFLGGCSWQQYAKQLEEFAHHYLTIHLGCKL